MPQATPSNTAAGFYKVEHKPAAYMVVDATAHDDVPWWWCSALLAWLKPLPCAALELQQHQQAGELWCCMVGQRTQQQLIHVEHMNPATAEQVMVQMTLRYIQDSPGRKACSTTNS
jgi:hypothetical protein